MTSITSRRLTGVAAAAVAAIGVLGAGAATAATPNPTSTNIVCPANMHVGAAATCGVSVTDLGRNPVSPRHFVQLKTNVGPNHGTFTSTCGINCFNAFGYFYCFLTPVNARLSRCSFSYTPTTPGRTRMYGVYTADDGLHLQSHSFTDFNVVP